jgi:sugar diacid utilization regulator
MNIILEKFFLNKQQNLYAIKNDEIIMIIDHTFAKDLEYTLRNILKESQESLHTQLIFGIGLTTSNTITFKQSYDLAKSTISWAKLFSSDSIHYFIDLGLILNHTSSRDKHFFI